MYANNRANQGGNMIFHTISQDILDWMQQYPEVKEESITDRLIYDSLKCRRFKAFPFSRIEEADIGADWEWWVIINRRREVYAYRFLVQAKRIKKGTRNCYSLFNYKKGAQLQSLLENSRLKKAMPLYMVYTVEKQDFKRIYDSCESQKIRDILLSCKNCKNGAFLTPAYYVEELLMKAEELMKAKVKSIDVEDVLNKALKLSFLDCIMPVEDRHLYYLSRVWGHKNRYFEEMYELPGKIMSTIARYLYKKWWCKDDDKQEDEDNRIPFCYSLEDIPVYVTKALSEEEKDYEQWYERELRYKLEGLAGVAILDLRDSIVIPED